MKELGFPTTSFSLVCVMGSNVLKRLLTGARFRAALLAIPMRHEYAFLKATPNHVRLGVV